MSDKLTAGHELPTSENPAVAAAGQQDLTRAEKGASPQEKLDEVEDIDFLLEEIENKIAPLALA